MTRGEGAAEGIFDASTGARISPLSEQLARKVAEMDYLGDGEIVRAALMSFPPQEYRGPTPVWRLDYNDRFNTRIYVSPSSGEVRARRNDIWRLYDFFWMLHIMDYEDRENFNNPLLITASITGFIFALSGIIIVVFRLSRGRYLNDLSLFWWGRKKSAKAKND